MKVLFLTHRLPYAPNRGDRARAFHLSRTLAKVVELDIVSLVHDDAEARETTTVEQMGVRVHALRTRGLAGYARGALALAGARPLTHVLLDAPALNDTLSRVVRERRPDVVLAYCSGMARLAMEPPLASLPLVLDMVDVDSEKWAILARSASWPWSWLYRREARYLARFERAVVHRAAVTLVVNERERRVLRRLAPDAPIEVIQCGVDMADLRPVSGPTDAPVVTFCGVMNYVPNVDGVLWFAREVWPAVLARVPAARFVIIGSDPTAAIRKLASTESRIEVTGRVADVRPYLWDAAVSVAPLATARGVQNKVLEALAAGLPCVVTPQVFAGLPAQTQSACRVAEGVTCFAEAVVSLLAMRGTERREVASGADLTSLAWEAQLHPVLKLLTGAASQARRPPERLDQKYSQSTE